MSHGFPTSTPGEAALGPFEPLHQAKRLSRAACDAVTGMRVHQWLKNLLIFVPAATAHQILNPLVFERVFLAFFSFSVCASAGYLVNDLLDLQADRRHPTKRKRPFAAGALSRFFGTVTAVVLFLTAVGFGNLVSGRYVFFLCGYLLLTLAYSVFLKTQVLIDIFLLAFFYTSRILAGGEAAHVVVSFWLAAFSTFFFFSVATLKRFVELRLLLKEESGSAMRRNYRGEDVTMLGLWGTASGCASVVVLALYINSQDVIQLYHRPAFLWPVCLAVLFWLNRVWMLANRNELPYDPIEFAVRDRYSYVIAAFVLSAILLAI
jgi:4-hydroxybenzoate polyprenyltransferase